MTLEVNGLWFSYGTVEVLVDITLDLREGEITSFVGPNGAGKSTLLKCIDRILVPQRGSVFVDGRDLARLGAKRLARFIGYVPQSSVEVFAFTVFDMVLMGRRPLIGWRASSEDLNVVAETLDYLGIGGLSNRFYHELSGGEKQRVSIARALVQEPGILLLDEPISNLDIMHQLEVMDVLTCLSRERGILTVMVLHDLNLASRFSDRVILLKDRRVFRDGTPEQVFTTDNIAQAYGVSADVSVGLFDRPHIVPIEPVRRSVAR